MSYTKTSHFLLVWLWTNLCYNWETSDNEAKFRLLLWKCTVKPFLIPSNRHMGSSQSCTKYSLIACSMTDWLWWLNPINWILLMFAFLAKLLPWRVWVDCTQTSPWLSTEHLGRSPMRKMVSSRILSKRLWDWFRMALVEFNSSFPVYFWCHFLKNATVLGNWLMTQVKIL